MRINVYLSENEGAFVREKGKGYLRRLVQAEMMQHYVEQRRPALTGEMIETEQEVHRRLAQVDASIRQPTKGPVCKECGSMVMAGKCLVCGVKQ
jgi:hypothetical protein